MRVQPHDTPDFNPLLDYNGKTICMIRGGGFGDLLMLTPLIREIKNRWNCEIHVACGDRYHSIFEGLPVTPVSLPIPTHSYDYVVSFEEWIEGMPKAKFIHMAEHFADKIGINLESFQLDYSMSKDESRWADLAMPIGTSRRIGVQVLSSAMLRSYPLIMELVEELSKTYEVLLFGSPNQINLQKRAPANVINTTDKGFTFRESVALMDTCDVLVSPDSAMFHLGGALGRPTIGLYGPFPGKLRATSPCQHVIEGKSPCSPCFFHAQKSTDYPLGMPCSENSVRIGIGTRCEALKSITVQSIIELVEKLL
jgi:ADP-heptose:LPS heptosyltransferase